MDETTFKDEIEASEAVEFNMKAYARYSALEIMPHQVDGLKQIHRRIIWVLGITESKKKCSALTGEVMDKVHPHGDNGITDAIVRLAQPFNQCQPLVHADGSFGAYGGGDAAAGRYLDVKPAQFTKDIFYNRVNTKTFTFIPSETGVGYEPAYLVPIIPTAFIMGAFTIAVGFKSFIPHLNLMNVCSMVETFLKLRREKPLEYHKCYSDIAKYCVPDFPTHSLLRNYDNIVDSYEQGNYRLQVVMDGVIELYPNHINIRSIPYGKSFEKSLKNIGQEFKKASFTSSVIQEVTELTTGWEYGDLELTLKRGVNPFDILDKIKRLAGFTTSVTPIWNFTDETGVLSEHNPMALLELWYNARYRSILADLKMTNVDLFKQYRKLMALIIIADHTDEVLAIFKAADNREATIKPLKKKFNLSSEQAGYISELPMHSITKQSKEDLLKRLQAVKDRIKAMQHKFLNIDAIIQEDIDFIRKNYENKTQRRTLIPNFMGAVYVKDSGYIQVRSIQEMAQLIKRWGNNTCELCIYPKGEYHSFAIDSMKFVDEKYDLPKEFKAQYLHISKTKPYHTVMFSGNQVVRFEGIIPQKDTTLPCCYIGNRCTLVYKDGEVKTVNYSDIPKRRYPVPTLGVSEGDCIYVSNVVSQDLIVVHTTDKDINTVYFTKITNGNGKLVKHLFGDLHVIGIWKYGDPIAFTIPDQYLSRCSIRHIYIKDISYLIERDPNLWLHVNKKVFSTKGSLVQAIKNLDLYSDKSIKEKVDYE